MLLDPSGEPVGKIEAFSPGEEAEPLAVELQPATYTLQCILETEHRRVHRDLGMVAELVVE